MIYNFYRGGKYENPQNFRMAFDYSSGILSFYFCAFGSSSIWRIFSRKAKTIRQRKMNLNILQIKTMKYKASTPSPRPSTLQPIPTFLRQYWQSF